MTQNNFKVKSGIEIPSLDTFVCTDQTQIPSVQPSLNLDFTTKQLDPRITFTRLDATPCATYTDQLGVIRTAPANVPRFDHDPVTGKCLGLLIEESRTNSCAYSSVFTSWTSAGVGISFTAGQADPTGGTGACVITESSSTDYGYIYSNAISYAAAENVCASIYVKKDAVPRATRNVLFRMRFGSSSRDLEVYLDTSTGENTVAAESGMTLAGGGVIDCGDWWRIWIAGTHATAASNVNIHLYPAVGTNFATNVATTGSITIWGAQLEKGAFPTSYIDVPSTTAVTRATDYASMTGTNFSSWYNQEQGSIQMQYRLGTKLASIRLASFTDGIGQNVIEVIAAYGTVPQVTSGPYLYGTVNGSTTINTSVAGKINVPYNTIKFSGAYKLNDYISYTNDVPFGAADNSAGIPIVDRLYFGNYSNSPSAMICGHIQKFTYYPKRLSNAELQALSTL